MHIVVLCVHRLPVADHVDILLADDESACVVQVRMGVPEAERVCRDVCVGAAGLSYPEIGIHHESPSQVSGPVVDEI